MPRATYDDGYQDGYADAESEYRVDDDIEFLVKDYLRKIRMGYTLDVTLQDVLEEMERMVRE